MALLILDSTSKSIVVAMSGAAATTNPDFTAAWADNNGTTFTEGASDGALNGTSSVTLVAAPAASTRRTVKTITIENKDTAAVTITVSYNNAATLRTIAKVTLQVGDTWTIDGTFDTTGSIKQTASNVNLTTGVTGILPIANGGTGASTLAGANIPVVNVANTFTGTQTFNGTSSTLAMVLANSAETTTISATAATGTINYDVTTQSVLYYTTNASANWTVNFRGSSGTSLNTLLSTGQSVTVVFLVTQGSTAYYNSAVQVDGASVTPKYQGGSAWTQGNASGIDAYTYVILKTGNAAFTIFASQTQFK
jgi:hypothetical protein